MSCFDKSNEKQMVKLLIKGMLVGAVIGMGASLVTASDMSGKCKKMRRKTACVMKNAGRLMEKAADRMY